MGRPRELDINKALDRALEVFWQHGCEGAMIPDLTQAMGINRPSLYAAFGNKEAMFRKALDRYRTGPAAFARFKLHLLASGESGDYYRVRKGNTFHPNRDDLD